MDFNSMDEGVASLRFDRYGRVLSAEERELKAKARGLCPTCGRPTHKLTKHLHRLKPLDDGTFVANGVCLKCHPPTGVMHASVTVVPAPAVPQRLPGAAEIPLTIAAKKKGFLSRRGMSMPVGDDDDASVQSSQSAPGAMSKKGFRNMLNRGRATYQPASIAKIEYNDDHDDDDSEVEDSDSNSNSNSNSNSDSDSTRDDDSIEKDEGLLEELRASGIENPEEFLRQSLQQSVNHSNSYGMDHLDSLGDIEEGDSEKSEDNKPFRGSMSEDLAEFLKQNPGTDLDFLQEEGSADDDDRGRTKRGSMEKDLAAFLKQNPGTDLDYLQKEDTVDDDDVGDDHADDDNQGENDDNDEEEELKAILIANGVDPDEFLRESVELSMRRESKIERQELNSAKERSSRDIGGRAGSESSSSSFPSYNNRNLELPDDVGVGVSGDGGATDEEKEDSADDVAKAKAEERKARREKRRNARKNCRTDRRTSLTMSLKKAVSQSGFNPDDFKEYNLPSEKLSTKSESTAKREKRKTSRKARGQHAYSAPPSTLSMSVMGSLTQLGVNVEEFLKDSEQIADNMTSARSQMAEQREAGLTLVKEEDEDGEGNEAMVADNDAKIDEEKRKARRKAKSRARKEQQGLSDSGRSTNSAELAALAAAEFNGTALGLVREEDDDGGGNEQMKTDNDAKIDEEKRKARRKARSRARKEQQGLSDSGMSTNSAKLAASSAAEDFNGSERSLGGANGKSSTYRDGGDDDGEEWRPSGELKTLKKSRKPGGEKRRKNRVNKKASGNDLTMSIKESLALSGFNPEDFLKASEALASHEETRRGGK